MSYDEGYSCIKLKWKLFHEEQEQERIKHDEDRAKDEQERLQKVASNRIKSELSKRQMERERVAKEERERDAAIRTAKAKEKLAKDREVEAMEREARERARENKAKAAWAQERWAEKMRQEAREGKPLNERLAAPEAKKYTAWRISTGETYTSYHSYTSRSTKNNAKCPTKSKRTSCAHVGLWPRVEGQHQCSVCSKTFFSFILRCSECKVMACASCRRQLRDRY